MGTHTAIQANQEVSQSDLTSHDPWSEETAIAQTVELFSSFIPANTHLTIEINSCPFGERYIYRLHYRSANSGRTMAMVVKTNSLDPMTEDSSQFILRQLILTPKEVGVEFARIYWREKNARQADFLEAGKLRKVMVSDPTKQYGYRQDLAGSYDGDIMKDRSDHYGDLI